MFFVFCIYSESISISDVGAGGGATCENGGNRASVTSAGLLDAGAGTSNPLPKILMNSSIPRTIMVSAYPRCPWHRGHCFTSEAILTTVPLVDTALAPYQASATLPKDCWWYKWAAKADRALKSFSAEDA